MKILDKGEQIRAAFSKSFQTAYSVLCLWVRLLEWRQAVGALQGVEYIGN